ncbi:DUF2461 domain-containing protein [Nocardioides abyssi]|uniref:DUF2461 domain-containing protein n=1 Tax=Nocardioides abyssi TaxID=3058370 RepID=A0ABT8ERS3_9ACTN|nr:DUF2461 domain-containing protein [Nocardioides abyssi]MDN4160857.1 DUF2461 domain-containing protein [Nocardioides abyssi]
MSPSSTSPAQGPFAGIPVAALDFYDDLEVDNTRSFWEKHKDTYLTQVRAPVEALCAALEPEFGAAKVFRPHRDVRFAKDKTPFKTHQGAFVRAAESTGWYVEVSPRGVRTGGGFYEASAGRLAAYRGAVDHDQLGAELEAMVGELEAAGWERGGDRLKTSPRGYDVDHPRIDLLRHRSLSLGHVIGFEPVIHTSELLDVVREDWRALRPLVEWVARHTTV